MKRSLLPSLFAASALLLVSGSAFAWNPIDGSKPVWGSMPVHYKVNQNSIPGSISSIGVARVDAGFAAWGAPDCSAFSAQNDGNTTASYNDGQNVIRWLSNSWPNELGDVNSVIGVTLPVWGGQNSELFDADITFNDVGFSWDDAGQGGNVDTQSIATHEEGHFLGLDHSNSSGATMAAAYGGGKGPASLSDDDIAGVCALYPSGSASSATSSGSGGGDCNTCLDQTSGGACSAPYNACANSQQCINFYDCATNCDSDACVNGCFDQFPTGGQMFSDLSNCWCNACASECSDECGTSSSSSSTSAATTGSGPATTSVGSGDAVTTGTGETTANATGTTGTGIDAATTGGISVGPGAGGAGATSGGGGHSDDPKNFEPEEDTGCGCSTTGTPGGMKALALVALFGGLLERRRRKNAA